MSRRGIERAVLLFVILVLFNCAKTETPRLAPTAVPGLVLGMTLEEVEKSIGPCLYTPIAIVYEHRKIVERFDYLLYKTERDRSEGKKTPYRLYFLYEKAPHGKPPHEGPNFFGLVYWSEEANWEKDEAILKKTRFK